MDKLTFEDLKYFQDKVVNWNVIFGNNPDDKGLVGTYVNLTNEEFNGAGEYVESLLKGDLVGRLDGIVDNIFTGFMWMVLENTPITKEWFDMVSGSEVEDIDTLIENIKDALEISYVEDYKLNFVKLLLIEQDLFDIKGAFDLVLESNMSKALHPNISDVDTELVRIQKEGRYDDLFKGDSSGLVILRAYKDLEEGKYYPKGKIIKPSTYKSPEELGGLNQFVLSK